MLDRQQMRQLKIEPPDQAVYKEVLGNWDALAKPLDGMGEFEELFARIGAIRRDPALDISRKAVVVMCADNGIVEEKISQSGQAATTRYDLHTRLNAMHDHIKVCHGDFHPSNVIVDKDGRLHVIDWSHATQGNGSADAARTFLLFKLEGKDDWAELYLKMFCDMNDVARQYVSQWMPIVAASQLVKHKPEEKDFLMRWIDVFDYE